MLSYSELHGLGTSSPQLSRHNNLTSLGARLHDEPQHTVAGSPDSQAVQQLVPQALALCNSRETPVLDLGGIQRYAVLGELETLLDEGGELANATALLSEDFLSVCGANDDIGNGGSDADFDARVALLGEFTLEEFIELGVEDTIGDELSALGTVGG